MNEKIARWAGFTLIDTQFYNHSFGNSEVDIWLDPSGLTCQGGCPNFTESLDAYFKWVVPKLDTYTLHYDNTRRQHLAFAELNGKASGSSFDENPALALCLAVERLIDSEEYRNKEV